MLQEAAQELFQSESHDAALAVMRVVLPVPAMLSRLENADTAFHGVLTDVRNRSAWEDTFVDALCEPPETFTFGGMFAHVITFNAYRRMLAIDALRRLGVKVEGFGCPMDYVASLASG
jgi:hypothetical protein